MFDRKADLLIDIGNTRIKYVWCDSTGSLSEVLILDDWSNAEQLVKQSASVTAASVNRDELIQRLGSLAGQFGIPFQEIKSSQGYLGVSCPYKTPDKLGVDRWLCGLAIAVAQRRGEMNNAVGVVDFGTAANCEFIINGDYLGGWIAPGFELMRNALVAGTTKVSANEQYPSAIAIGTDTEDCVNAGCLAMISGMVRAAYFQLEKQLGLSCEKTMEQNAAVSKPLIVVTGGTASSLKSLLQTENLQVIYIPDLIFQGLRLFLSQPDT